MAAEAVTLSWWQRVVLLPWQRTVAFVRDAAHEIRHKTTWPDLPQVRQASVAIIIFVLIIGLVITLLDLALSGVLLKLIPSLFR